MSTIIKTMVQLKGESEPQQHFALVFDDVMSPADFMMYRNALTTAAKAMLNSDESDLYSSELFYLIQLSEFINTALDVELYWKGGDNG
ncbi:MAG: hypothetical protein IJQ13_04515 [Prevotella sp.]|nr:hypothetical protein [Prevotella sp.]